ncbi:capsular polysaccharide export protein, LipB/KpsS family [Altererythrobacter sp. B11]|uniref:capsular polysaccharide export protein, LipB/KpsS family n=1 Tax=Altererythrobacter sp. B11 TaxID=2060312 RepID=UPI001E49AEC9|nr:beta-3-deoxy-D-manno-oct-2-ulosonic acid transferase [Altererythrobacter sp. B11]
MSRPASGGEAEADCTAAFDLIRAAQVGGRFWAAPARLVEPVGAVLLPGAPEDIPTLLGRLDPAERRRALWIAPPASASAARRWSSILARLTAAEGGAWRGDVDPWSVLGEAERVVAHGSDEWVALGRIAGLPVEVLSPGRFGAPGEDGSTLDQHVARALAETAWRDPFTDRESTIEVAVELLATWRRMLEANRPLAAASGMAWWKRTEIRHLLWHPQRKLHLVRGAGHAVRVAARGGGALAIWPSRVSPALLRQAREQGVPLVRVEDGFVRSVGLGVDLVPPSSVVVDSSGIHFDPSGPSDLETILEGTEFSPALRDRAAALRDAIVAGGISKYSAGGAAPLPPREPGRRLVLVPGQVEDDMSVLAGGGGLTSNLELLRRARALEPAAEIWFRPHPDVDAGHRKGAVPDAAILEYADRVVRGGGMAPLLDAVDTVHVLTSLTGFEALMRGREVTCHGTPFYAGWGLTRDLGEVPARRSRKLALDELVAGVLILYPRYLDPVTGLPCRPEVLVRRMADAGAGVRYANRLGWIAPLRRWQGRIMAAIR